MHCLNLHSHAATARGSSSRVMISIDYLEAESSSPGDSPKRNIVAARFTVSHSLWSEGARPS